MGVNEFKCFVWLANANLSMTLGLNICDDLNICDGLNICDDCNLSVILAKFVTWKIFCIFLKSEKYYLANCHTFFPSSVFDENVIILHLVNYSYLQKFMIIKSY